MVQPRPALAASRPHPGWPRSALAASRPHPGWPRPALAASRPHPGWPRPALAASSWTASSSLGGLTLVGLVPPLTNRGRARRFVVLGAF